MKLLTLLAMSLTLFASSAFAQDAEEKKADKPTDNAVKTKVLAEGDKAPDFELESLDGKTVKLSERFAGDDAKPVVLLFSRAHW